MEDNKSKREPDDSGSGRSQPPDELALEEKVRSHEFVLKSLQYEQIDTRERLTLIVLNTLLSIAGLITIIAVTAAGVGLVELEFAVEFLKNTYLRFFGLASVVVFLITVVTSGVDSIVSTYKLIAPWRSWREDLPPQPDTLKSEEPPEK
jgi:hypothetical protein